MFNFGQFINLFEIKKRKMILVSIGDYSSSLNLIAKYKNLNAAPKIFLTTLYAYSQHPRKKSKPCGKCVLGITSCKMMNTLGIFFDGSSVKFLMI